MIRKKPTTITFPSQTVAEVPVSWSDLEEVQIYNYDHTDGNPIRYKFVSRAAKRNRRNPFDSYRVRMKLVIATGDIETIDLSGRYSELEAAKMLVRWLKTVFGSNWKEEYKQINQKPDILISAFDSLSGCDSPWVGRVVVNGTEYTVENPQPPHGYKTQQEATEAAKRWLREYCRSFLRGEGKTNSGRVFGPSPVEMDGKYVLKSHLSLFASIA